MQRERDPQRGTSGEVTTAQRQLVYAQAYLQKKDDTEWDTVWGLISREVWFYGYDCIHRKESGKFYMKKTHVWKSVGSTLSCV